MLDPTAGNSLFSGHLGLALCLVVDSWVASSVIPGKAIVPIHRREG